jgi:hypothetical protein
MKILFFIQTIIAILALSYVMPAYISGLVFLQILAIIINNFGPFIGLLLLIFMTFKIKHNNKLFNLLLLCWAYQLGLMILNRYNIYIGEATEFFNVDRGDILPPLSKSQQSIGFLLNSLLYTLPISLSVLYSYNSELPTLNQRL